MTSSESSVDSHLPHESASYFRDGNRQRQPNRSQSALQITEQDVFVTSERNPSTVATSQKAPADGKAVHVSTHIGSERLMHMRIPSRSAPFTCDNDIDDDDSNECLLSSLVACDKNVEHCSVITTSPRSNSDQSRWAATAGSVMSPGGGRVDNNILGPSAILPSHAVYTGMLPTQPHEQKSDDAEITHKSITTQKYGSDMLPGASSRSSLLLAGSSLSSGLNSVRSIPSSNGGGACRIVVPNTVSSPRQRTGPNKRRGTTQNKNSRKRKSRARKEPWENDEETSDEACFDSEEELSSVQNADCADDAALALQLHYDEKKRAAASDCTSDAVCGSREDPLVCSDDVDKTNNPRDAANFKPQPRRRTGMRTRSNINNKQTFLNTCVNGELTGNFVADEDDEDFLLAKALSEQDADNDVHVAEHILAGCGVYEANFRAQTDDQVRRGVINSLQGDQLKCELHATEIVGGVDCNETRSCTAFDRLDSAEIEETLDADRGLILGYVAHLCRPPADHFAWNLGDDKWGCGLRNAQMLWSAMNRHPVLREHLAGQLRAADLDDVSATIAASLDVSARVSNFVSDAAASSGPFPVPSIHMLQKLICRAWRLGYDAHGAEDFHQEIVGTDKWIGPTEVHALLTSLAVECRGATFHLHDKAAVDAKGVPKNAHMCSYSNTGSLRTYRTLFDAMFDWVERHFTQLNKEYKFPIYLQHAGHSRTIVGFEKMPKGDGFERKLLLFDPATKLAMKTSTGRNLLRLVRRLPSNFKVGQWQMLTVTGRVLSCSEQLALRQPDAASFESFEFLDERNVS